ncbi:MAG TPA: hypothetical protein VHD33_06495 [Legionellaceae bacterium]|nr:hypothetical protein [Legionellaceae bacterium]HVV54971.1 hypothetical protein [Mucilaginibacter sp.]
MKSFFPIAIILLFAFLTGCEPVNRTPDTRPKEEIAFLNRVNAEGEFTGTHVNSVLQDAHIKAFDKYAYDSLKHISNWKMIFLSVDDDQANTNSVASVLGINANPCYNVRLTAPINLIKSEDEFGNNISYGNRVDFTYTVLKTPNDTNLEKRIELIKDLKMGDTVLVSGALTHVNGDGKPSFAVFYIDAGTKWNVDLIATKFEKSPGN